MGSARASCTHPYTWSSSSPSNCSNSFSGIVSGMGACFLTGIALAVAPCGATSSCCIAGAAAIGDLCLGKIGITCVACSGFNGDGAPAFDVAAAGDTCQSFPSASMCANLQNAPFWHCPVLWKNLHCEVLHADALGACFILADKAVHSVAPLLEFVA